MQFFLLLVVLLSAMLDWYAVYRQWKKAEFILKPLTMALLFFWLFFSTGMQGIALWFGIGIALSLAGDIFLMLPKEQFIAGLAAFLLAHIAYIIGFNQTALPLNGLGLLFALILAVLAVWLYRRIAEGLTRQGKESLKMPVLAYTAVISVMVLSALLTLLRPDWGTHAAVMASLGAALFMLSDAILAWNKFVEAIPHGRVMNMMAYHLGQIVLMIGIVSRLAAG